MDIALGPSTSMHIETQTLVLSEQCACTTCADLENFVREGPTLRGFLLVFVVIFLVDWGWVDLNSTISEPSSACQQNAIK